jgi:hypothetical protein
VTRALQRASATLYALVLALVHGDGAGVARRAREIAALVLQDAAPQNRRRRARALPDQQRRTCSLTAPRARPPAVRALRAASATARAGM